MERITFSSKNREFDITVLAGTSWVFQKMLSNSRVMGNDLRSAVFLAGTGKIRAILGIIMVSDQPGNVLLNAFLQPLGCTSYMSTIAVVHKLINNNLKLIYYRSFTFASAIYYRFFTFDLRPEMPRYCCPVETFFFCSFLEM